MPNNYPRKGAVVPLYYALMTLGKVDCIGLYADDCERPIDFKLVNDPYQVMQAIADLVDEAEDRCEIASQTWLEFGATLGGHCYILLRVCMQDNQIVGEAHKWKNDVIELYTQLACAGGMLNIDEDVEDYASVVAKGIYLREDAEVLLGPVLKKWRLDEVHMRASIHAVRRSY